MVAKEKSTTLTEAQRGLLTHVHAYANDPRGAHVKGAAALAAARELEAAGLVTLTSNRDGTAHAKLTRAGRQAKP